jgi:hypothetical protein
VATTGPAAAQILDDVVVVVVVVVADGGVRCFLLPMLSMVRYFRQEKDK